jgi:hypothetical protein
MCMKSSDEYFCVVKSAVLGCCEVIIYLNSEVNSIESFGHQVQVGMQECAQGLVVGQIPLFVLPIYRKGGCILSLLIELLSSE